MHHSGLEKCLPCTHTQHSRVGGLGTELRPMLCLPQAPCDFQSISEFSLATLYPRGTFRKAILEKSLMKRTVSFFWE